MSVNVNGVSVSKGDICVPMYTDINKVHIIPAHTHTHTCHVSDGIKRDLLVLIQVHLELSDADPQV